MRFDRLVGRLVLLACLGTASVLQAGIRYPSEPDPQSIDAHDPAVLFDGRTYYVYGTHNMPTWESKDLIEFERVARQLVEVPEEARDYVGGDAMLWAPDVVQVGEEFRLYYCLSLFGKSHSYIGFMTAKSPDGPFRDNQEITRSPDRVRGAPNALDPSILIDAKGKQWMVYGSFFGGIYLMRLDKDGTARKEGDPGERVAYRRASGAAMEGPCILYNAELEKYFLFVSYDILDTTYNVRVGCADDPEGPYLDFNGVDMNGDEDNIPKILNSYAFENHPGWDGPGHNSVLFDGENCFMLHHAREHGRVHTHVRKMVFLDEGWPVVSPERYAGEEEQPIPEKEIAGTWEFLPIAPNNNQMQHSVPGLTFEADGTLHLGGQTGKWQLKQPNSLRFFFEDEPVISAKVLPSWDWENEEKTLVFTGLNQEGIAVWGKKGD